MGGIRPLPLDNQPTGIFKREVLMPAWLGREGLAGDAQAGRRAYGGPDKALHQYPVTHYQRLAVSFPDAGELLIPGSIGENLSVPGWDETNVCTGDLFQLGDAVIQVCQPRNSCWKIDHRYGVVGMARLIADEGITGWHFFRVVEEGSVEPGCPFDLIERKLPEATLSQFLSQWFVHRPAPSALIALAATPGLAFPWVSKLHDRASRPKDLLDE